MKVGDRFDVIVATASQFKYLYKAGNCGVVVEEFDSGAVAAYIGHLINYGDAYFVDKGNYKKIGCLTIKKLK